MTTNNTFESRIGSFTVRGEAHSLGIWFVLALRLMMAYAFLHAGLGKVLAADPFSAQGYLMGASQGASPLAGLFGWMATTPAFVEFVNLAVPYGQVLIGLGLLVGGLVRLASFFGAFMMSMFYFANWNVAHGFVNGDLTYLVVFLTVAALGAGRVLGADAVIERTAIVEKYPALRYILG
jgi:thiosulfate dehydrogenase [quinone] large subunit